VMYDVVLLSGLLELGVFVLVVRLVRVGDWMIVS